MRRSTCTLPLTAIALCGAMITTALRAADDKWYAEADLGVSLVNNNDVERFIDSAGGEMEFEVGFASGLTVGYHLTPWMAAEFQTGYMLNGVDGVDAVLSQCPMMLNLCFELPNCKKFVPFAGVGVGGMLSVFSIDDYVDGDWLDGSSGEFVFAYQAFGGLRYNFNDQMGVALLYRFRGTQGPSWDVEDYYGFTVGEIALDDVFSHTFSVLYNFRF
jgi:opacity protein-like surface antigen